MPSKDIFDKGNIEIVSNSRNQLLNRFRALILLIENYKKNVDWREKVLKGLNIKITPPPKLKIPSSYVN